MARGGSVLLALGVCLLVTILSLILGWAVIGKHRLDPQARAVYKATRLIVAARSTDGVTAFELDTLCSAEAPAVTEAPARMPAVLRVRVAPPLRPSRARASRAPPRA